VNIDYLEGTYIYAALK